MMRGRGQYKARNNNPVAAAVMEQLAGTEEQEAVWDALLRTKLNVIVEAVAGSGKTWTIVQYALRERYKRVGLVAFNKHIADELKAKVAGLRNVECMTYHSLGNRALKQRFGFLKLDEHKVLGYLDTQKFYRTTSKGVEELDRDDSKTVKFRINATVGFAKSYGFDESMTEAEFCWLEEKHDLDFEGMRETVWASLPGTLKWCKENTSTIDFNDMVWLPYVLKLPVPGYDVLCVDEYQDTNTVQQWLALQAGKRLCAVGDSRQAIYAFRGADSRGFDRLRETLGKDNVVTLPLTLTRRCPQSHVKLAQRIVPQIKALDTAPEGKVTYVGTRDAAVEQMKPGDLVVCRVNAELVGTAYKLLKRGVRAVVRGRDVGAGIEKLIKLAGDKAGRDASLTLLLEHANIITMQEISKFNALPNGRGEARAVAAQDRLECLSEIASQCETTGELSAALRKLFDEFDDEGKPQNTVVLGTVHRTKGLEGNRVFVLRPDLMPHPMAKRKEEQEQERNLAYVAVTRAKYESAELPGELVFVGLESPLFPKAAEEDTTVDFPAPGPGAETEEWV